MATQEMPGFGSTIPEGTAYGRPPQQPDAALTRVGPGTAMGELMRRYWQPVLASRNVTARPREVRILGEDLIVFRDGEGRPGLLYPRCMHRGTSLLYGHVEADGIRCCYHGWKFAVDGQCLEQPCEPNPRACRPEHRQPWYPVRERYGLVWAYMGPPGRMPALPRFDAMEHIDDPQASLRRMGELIAPGGVAVLAFGPLFHSPYGDHMWDFFRLQIPWRGVLFSEQALLRVRAECFRPTDTAKSYREIAGGLNLMRYSEFLRYVRQTGWAFAYLAVNTFLRNKPALRALSGRLTRTPLLQDYFVHNVYAVLRRVDEGMPLAA